MRSGELLAIDVAAELHNLKREQLRGTWQVIAEGVRLAIGRGASSVEVERLRRGFMLRATGTTGLDDELRSLAVILDSDRSAVERHRALVHLEAAGAMPLLWLAGLDGGSLAVVSRTAAAVVALDTSAAGAPRLDDGERPGAGPGLEIRCIAPGLDVERAMAWVFSAARFAPVPVTLDGRMLAGGFGDPLVERRIRRPLPARLAVTWSDDAPRLWLLRDGVVAARATVPSYPAFAIAVEMAGVARDRMTSDQLRAALNPYLPELIDRTVELMISAMRRLAELSEPARRRLVILLLRSALCGLRRTEILALPMLPAEPAADDGLQVLSLGELVDVADRRDGLMHCLAPGERVTSSARRVAPVVRLSVEEQGLVSELLGIRLQRPPADRGGPLLRRTSAALRGAVDRLLGRRLVPWRELVVPDDELLEAERLLLGEIAVGLPEGSDARLTSGSGRIVRRGRRLLLPRHNPVVRRAVRLAAADERWLYPAVIGLLGEWAERDGELRARWRRGISSPGDGAAASRRSPPIE